MLPGSPGCLSFAAAHAHSARSYTKVLDEIKKIRKDQNVDIKVDREKLSALKTDRDRAFKVGLFARLVQASLR